MEVYSLENKISALLNDTKSISKSYMYWKKNISGSVEFKMGKIPFQGNVF
jgi:hypothetical protein